MQKTDSKGYERLAGLAGYLSHNEIDLRQLSQIRAQFYATDKQKKQLARVSLDKITESMATIFESFRLCD